MKIYRKVEKTTSLQLKVQAAKILEDSTYLLIASDEKGFTASANYEDPKDLAKLLMEFAVKHEGMMDAIMLVVKQVINVAALKN